MLILNTNIIQNLCTNVLKWILHLHNVFSLHWWEACIYFLYPCILRSSLLLLGFFTILFCSTTICSMSHSQVSPTPCSDTLCPQSHRSPFSSPSTETLQHIQLPAQEVLSVTPATPSFYATSSLQVLVSPSSLPSSLLHTCQTESTLPCAFFWFPSSALDLHNF